MQTSPRVLSLGIGVALVASAFGAGAPRVLVPGMTYTFTNVTMERVTGSLATRPTSGPTNDWKATVVFAVGRGRVDITDGAQNSRFKAGDYILFDSTDYIIVSPATKTFFVEGGYPPARSRDTLAQSVLSGATYTDFSVRLDSLGTDDVGGHPAQHLHMQYGYTMTIPRAASPPRYALQMAPAPSTVFMASDSWFATDVQLPPTPLHSLSSLKRSDDSVSRANLSGPLADLMAKVGAVGTAWPSNSRLLKSTMTMRISGASYSTTTEATLEVTGIASAQVDPAILVLPDGFRQVQPPTVGSARADSLPIDGGAKWRKP